MIVLDFISVFDENRNLIIRSQETEMELCSYNGKDSIDLDYNDYEIKRITTENGVVILYVD